MNGWDDAHDDLAKDVQKIDLSLQELDKLVNFSKKNYFWVKIRKHKLKKAFNY